MKKIKFLAVLMLLVVPFVGVNAETTYNSYKTGDIINFYSNDNEWKAGQEGDQTVGTYTMALEDSEATSQYVRVLADVSTYTGFTSSSLDRTNAAWTEILTAIETEGITTPYIKDKSVSGNVDFISLQELIDNFGATTTDGGESYTIDVNTWGTKFLKFADPIASHYLAYIATRESTDAAGGFGFYTGTVTSDGKYVWVVKFESDLTAENANDFKLNGIKIVKEEISASPATIYAELPVLYFDKTYDCKATVEETKTYACYKCSETEYSWLESGTEGSTCSVVDSITTEGKCVVPAKTGVADYALYVIAIVAAGTLALMVLKKKTLFQNM